MKINNKFAIREIAGDFILVPLGESALKISGMFTTNDVGAFIWKKLECGTNMESLINAVVGEFEVDESTAEKDVKEFIDIIRKLELLTE